MYKYIGYLKCADCKTSMYKFSRGRDNSVCFYCGAYHKKRHVQSII